jgi:hypothetical protein
VYPAVEGRCLAGGSRLEVFWLDWVQLQAVGRVAGHRFARRASGVAAGGLEIRPVFERANGSAGREPRRDWQYWNSHWDFAAPPPPRAEWWRVRPNESRDRPARFLYRLRRTRPGHGPQARGSFAACLHPEMLRKLGNPLFVVIRHPFRKGWLPVRVLKDEFKGKSASEEAGRELWGETIFLDRTARDGLGIADGEFCLVYPWLHPRGSVWWRAVRDRAVGARTIAAHPRAPARADLEKPVCRLDPAALEAIGGRAGDSILIEHVVPARGARASSHWQSVRVRQRVLPIDAAERAERAAWEAPQLWDDNSNPRRNSRAETAGETLDLEGYVDCAERLGVHPPYPTIYLNYYARRHRLKQLGLCQPVQVRVGVPGRLTAEASDFAWLVVIGVIGAAIAFLFSTPFQVAAAVLLALAMAILLAFRVIRAIR